MGLNLENTPSLPLFQIVDHFSFSRYTVKNYLDALQNLCIKKHKTIYNLKRREYIHSVHLTPL